MFILIDSFLYTAIRKGGIYKILSFNVCFIWDKEIKNWTLSIGFYPGICFGIRTYEEPDQTTYVLYIPFVDISLEIHDN